MSKVIFIGSNPSCTSPTDEPFAHCKSANKMINQWIPALGLTRDDVEFMNVANYKTKGNRPLTKGEVMAEICRLTVPLSNQVVITLGKTAEWTLSYMKAHVFLRGEQPVVINLPHPSGRNRILNDKAKVAEILGKARQQLQEIHRA